MVYFLSTKAEKNQIYENRGKFRINKHEKYFLNFAQQAKEDKEALVNSGLAWEIIKKGEVYLEKLSIEHGKRIASEGAEAEVEEQFKELMPQANAAKKIIMVVLRYIVARTGDSRGKRSYDMIRKGYGNMDTLQDIISGISVICKNMDLVSQVRPGGQTVSKRFLDESEALAIKLIKLKGDVTAAADEGSAHVDRQNRLITLCIQVQREIKLFAEIAFYDDPEHYNKFYASDRLREINRNREKTEEEQVEPVIQ